VCLIRTAYDAVQMHGLFMLTNIELVLKREEEAVCTIYKNTLSCTVVLSVVINAFL